jgi:hypothetical protein
MSTLMVWGLVAILAVGVLGGTARLLSHGITVGGTTVSVSLLPVGQWGFGEERLMPMPGMPPDPGCYYCGVFEVDLQEPPFIGPLLYSGPPGMPGFPPPIL